VVARPAIARIVKNNMANIDIKTLSDRQLLELIEQHSRQAKNYMKWQFIVTIALVVIPLLAALLFIPLALSSLTTLSGAYSGVLQ
jgi:hypothetical protein